VDGVFLARRMPISRNSWFPESASEWTASESIEADRDSPAATNLAIAIPKLAQSALMTTD